MFTISNVEITLNPGEKIRGYVTLTIDHAFVVHGIKIIQRGDGHLFTAMPSRKRRDGSYQDVAHPISSEARRLIEETVRSAYLRRIGTEGDGPEGPGAEHAAGFRFNP